MRKEKRILKFKNVSAKLDEFILANGLKAFDITRYLPLEGKIAKAVKKVYQASGKEGLLELLRDKDPWVVVRIAFLAYPFFKEEADATLNEVIKRKAYYDGLAIKGFLMLAYRSDKRILFRFNHTFNQHITSI